MAFEPQALCHFAVREGRTDELFGVPEFTNRIATEDVSGQDPLMQGKPSTALFRDFCSSLEDKLPHQWLSGTCVDVLKDSQTNKFQVLYESTAQAGVVQSLQANAVVLATGPLGKPNIPQPFLPHMGGPLVSHSDELLVSGRPFELIGLTKGSGARILVIGGGVTAVQLALAAVSEGHRVVLRSRGPINTREYDLHADWLDLRHSNRLRARFLSTSNDVRKQNVAAGGSVPREYMEQVKHAAESLLLQVDETIDSCEVDSRGEMVFVNGEPFERVILATGAALSLSHSPLYTRIQSNFNASTVNGLPHLDDSLRWVADEDLFVVGANSVLTLGPGARNLMGAMRGAKLVSQELHSLMWTHTKNDSHTRRVLANPFSVLSDDITDLECDGPSSQESAHQICPLDDICTEAECHIDETPLQPVALPELVVQAVRKGEMKKVSKWLRKGSVDAQCSCSGSTLLCLATFYRRPEIIRELLRRGANVNLPNHEGVTALMAAANTGGMCEALMLLQHSADGNIRRNDGGTAIMIAANSNQHEVLQLLLAHDSSAVNVQSEFGMSALMIAARSGADSCVKTLIQAGASVQQQCQAGKTALTYAEEKGHASTQLLLQHAPTKSHTHDLGPKQVLVDVGGGKTIQVSEESVRVDKRGNVTRRGCHASLRSSLLSKDLTSFRG
ncbi:MAG: hypothetical protein SGPRY_011399, partial [Prymnesium sp.]